MAKYYGPLGFGLSEQKETSPGVWELIPNERYYYGDRIKINRRVDSSAINGNFNVSSQLSIMADPYALAHYFEIRYAVVDGVKWTVLNVDVQAPRLLLTLGGLYVEQEN